MITRFWFLICLIGIGFVSLQAQNADDGRPKVGLVLSGGAAHGFAHVGVLQYMEEIGLEIDYITGTSMGSVIGGLYAMGYSADEIADIAGNQDWELLVSNHSPLWEVAPIEKSNHEKIPLSIFWNNNSFSLPRGIIKGQKLDLIISKIYCPAYFIDNFDNFHIPFKCVAVDIVDGSIDVLDTGFIGESIRASMAIPSVFPPKKIGNTLYVDGGLLRNFPVQENLDMGSDITIGVYVGSKPSKKEELKSSIGIFKQSLSMGSYLDSENQAKLLDVLIEPDVKDLGSFDFNDFQTFIDKGYSAARKNSDALKSIVKGQDYFSKPTRRPKLNKLDFLRFSDISTTDDDPVFRKMIVNALKFKENENVSFEQLEESLALVFGTKNFAKTTYDFDITEDGIELIVKTDEIEPYSLGVSLNRFKHYNASLILTGEARNIFGKPSSLRLDARLSENPGVQGTYYLRIPSNPTFIVKASAKYEKFQLPFFNNKVIDRLYIGQAGVVSLSINKEWKNKYLFHLTYKKRFDLLKSRVFKNNDLRRLSSSRNAFELGLSYNALDKQVFPEEGMKFSLNAGVVIDNDIERSNQSEGTDFLNFTDDNAYPYSEFDFHSYLTYLNLCFEFQARGRYSTGKSFLDNYKIGGPIQEKNYQYGFAGLDDSELIVGNHASARAALRFNLFKRLYVSPQVQYIYGEDYLSYAYETERFISELGYGVSLGLNTPIGPVVLEVGYSGFRSRAIATLGFGFRHIL